MNRRAIKIAREQLAEPQHRPLQLATVGCARVVRPLSKKGRQLRQARQCRLGGGAQALGAGIAEHPLGGVCAGSSLVASRTCHSVGRQFLTLATSIASVSQSCSVCIYSQARLPVVTDLCDAAAHLRAICQCAIMQIK